jgi:hypothetical protein
MRSVLFLLCCFFPFRHRDLCLILSTLQPFKTKQQQIITAGALVMELAAVAVLAATFFVYDHVASRDSAGYY